MDDFDRRIRSKMEFVLEEACRQLSGCGGDHRTRKHVARQLIRAARAGKIGLDDMRDVADQALRNLTLRKTA